MENKPYGVFENSYVVQDVWSSTKKARRRIWVWPAVGFLIWVCIVALILFAMLLFPRIQQGITGEALAIIIGTLFCLDILMGIVLLIIWELKLIFTWHENRYQ